MGTAVLWLLIGIGLATCYFILTTRRHTPYLELDLVAMPKITLSM